MLFGHRVAVADDESCKEYRHSIIAMEATSVRPPG